MKVILKKDVENLGLEFDTVDVKPGYARNYLIPQGFALLATPKNQTVLADILDSRKEEEAKAITSAKEIVEKLKTTPLSITAKTGTGDKLFGSINNSDISEKLSLGGIKIDKKYIKIPGNTIKRTGNYSAKIRLHREVEYDFPFSILAEVTEEYTKKEVEKTYAKDSDKKEENN